MYMDVLVRLKYISCCVVALLKFSSTIFCDMDSNSASKGIDRN